MVWEFSCGDQREGFRGDALRVLDEAHGVLNRGEHESSFVAAYVGERDLGNRVVLIIGKDALQDDEMVGVNLERESSASVALPLELFIFRIGDVGAELGVGAFRDVALEFVVVDPSEPGSRPRGKSLESLPVVLVLEGSLDGSNAKFGNGGVGSGLDCCPRKPSAIA